MRIQARLPENSSDNVFSSLQLILQFYRGCPIFQRKLKFSKVSESFQHFPGGGGSKHFFQGVQMLISIETDIKL